MNKQKIVDAFNQIYPRTPLSEFSMKTLLTLMMTKDKEFSVDLKEIDIKSDIYKHFKPLIESFPAQVFLKRLEGLSDIHMTLGVLIMLMEYMKNPGSCVMYAYYIHNKLPSNTLVDIDTFSIRLFPFGMFSKKQLENIWDTQKVNKNDDVKNCECIGAHDNLLDYSETWKK
jgi:hypothetical protein